MEQLMRAGVFLILFYLIVFSHCKPVSEKPLEEANKSKKDSEDLEIVRVEIVSRNSTANEIVVKNEEGSKKKSYPLENELSEEAHRKAKGDAKNKIRHGHEGPRKKVSKDVTAVGPAVTASIGDIIAVGTTERESVEAVRAWHKEGKSSEVTLSVLNHVIQKFRLFNDFYKRIPDMTTAEKFRVKPRLFAELINEFHTMDDVFPFFLYIWSCYSFHNIYPQEVEKDYELYGEKTCCLNPKHDVDYIIQIATLTFGNRPSELDCSDHPFELDINSLHQLPGHEAFHGLVTSDRKRTRTKRNAVINYDFSALDVNSPKLIVVPGNTGCAMGFSVPVDCTIITMVATSCFWSFVNEDTGLSGFYFGTENVCGGNPCKPDIMVNDLGRPGIDYVHSSPENSNLTISVYGIMQGYDPLKDQISVIGLDTDEDADGCAIRSIVYSMRPIRLVGDCSISRIKESDSSSFRFKSKSPMTIYWLDRNVVRTEPYLRPGTYFRKIPTKKFGDSEYHARCNMNSYVEVLSMNLREFCAAEVGSYWGFSFLRCAAYELIWNYVYLASALLIIFLTRSVIAVAFATIVLPFCYCVIVAIEKYKKNKRCVNCGKWKFSKDFDPDIELKRKELEERKKALKDLEMTKNMKKNKIQIIIANKAKSLSEKISLRRRLNESIKGLKNTIKQMDGEDIAKSKLSETLTEKEKEYKSVQGDVDGLTAELQKVQDAGKKGEVDPSVKIPEDDESYETVSMKEEITKKRREMKDLEDSKAEQENNNHTCPTSCIYCAVNISNMSKHMQYCTSAPSSLKNMVNFHCDYRMRMSNAMDKGIVMTCKLILVIAVIFACFKFSESSDLAEDRHLTLERTAEEPSTEFLIGKLIEQLREQRSIKEMNEMREMFGEDPSEYISKRSTLHGDYVLQEEYKATLKKILSSPVNGNMETVTPRRKLLSLESDRGSGWQSLMYGNGEEDGYSVEIKNKNRKKKQQGRQRRRVWPKALGKAQREKIDNAFKVDEIGATLSTPTGSMQIAGPKREKNGFMKKYPIIRDDEKEVIDGVHYLKGDRIRFRFAVCIVVCCLLLLVSIYLYDSVFKKLTDNMVLKEFVYTIRLVLCIFLSLAVGSALMDGIDYHLVELSSGVLVLCCIILIAVTIACMINVIVRGARFPKDDERKATKKQWSYKMAYRSACFISVMFALVLVLVRINNLSITDSSIAVSELATSGGKKFELDPKIGALLSAMTLYQAAPVLSIMPIFYYCIQKVSGSEMMMQDNHNLKIHGFEMSDVMLDEEDYERKTLYTTSTMSDCEEDGGNCMYSIKVKFTMRMLETYSSGFFLKDDTGEYRMNVRLNRVTAVCPARKLYKTCQTMLQTTSYSKCTGSCDDCINKLRIKMGGSVNDASNSEYYCQKDQNKVGCKDKGCWATKGGTTCVLSQNIPLLSNCTTVYATVPESCFIRYRMCVSVQSKALCINSKSTSEASDDFNAVLSTEINRRPAEIFALRDGQDIPLYGPINDAGDFSTRFGSIQVGSDDRAICVRNYICVHQCFYLKPRRYDCKQGCLDTYGLIKNLRAKEMVSFDRAKEQVIRRMDDAGSGEFTLNLGGIRKVSGDNDLVKILTISIESILGCYGCQSGAVMHISIESTKNAVIMLWCTGITLSDNQVHVSKSMDTYNIHVSSSVEEPEVICEAKGTKSIAYIPKLMTGVASSGDTGVYGQSSAVFAEKNCGANIFCDLGKTFRSLFHWSWDFIIYILYAALVIISIIAAYFIYVKFIKPAKIRADVDTLERKVQNIQVKKGLSEDIKVVEEQIAQKDAAVLV